MSGYQGKQNTHVVMCQFGRRHRLLGSAPRAPCTGARARGRGSRQHRTSCAYLHACIGICFILHRRDTPSGFSLCMALHLRDDLAPARAKSQAPRPVFPQSTSCIGASANAGSGYIAIVANANAHGVRGITRQNTPARAALGAESCTVQADAGRTYSAHAAA
ncbi:hypothetical protein FB451DRAFT_1166732 [Mycena latifolia]|nr:hypothetical protein FB451DRAFT_1166732 [Mycena latifolia]